MIISSILNKEIPFKDFDCVSAGDLIVSGKISSTSLIERENKDWISVLSNCLNENITERLAIHELKEELNKLAPLRKSLNEKMREKILKKKEGEDIGNQLMQSFSTFSKPPLPLPSTVNVHFKVELWESKKLALNRIYLKENSSLVYW
jgi:hypothetical protein